MEIYTFDKSLQERMVELSEILSGRGEVVPASQIQAEWSYHVELVIEPVGWRALWKISRVFCERFQIHYPTIVVVEVEQVDYADLSALVLITAVQDDIHLPNKLDVPLIELYPTLHQEDAVLDMVGTSNCIDQLRFFYNYLWMPWDLDEDDSTDWVSAHLETRIRLFFDMKRGSVAKEASEIIRGLIREGREIHQKISLLEDSIPDEEEPDTDLADEGKSKKDVIPQLLKLHFRLREIKTEMEVLENPAMREVLVKNRSDKFNQKSKDQKEAERQKEGYFVWIGDNWAQLRTAMEAAESFFPAGIPIKISGCLQETLHNCEPGDIIVVGDGKHQIRGAGNLEEGGAIRGIFGTQKAILSSKEADTVPSLLDFSGSEVLLENICVNANELMAGIIVRCGTTKIINCRISSASESMVKLGIVVLPGAKLLLENTEFEGLGTAVVVYEKADVVIVKCGFQNCAEGIRLHDNGKLNIRSCSLVNLKEYAIRMETEQYLNNSEKKTGGVELLHSIPDISIEECKFGNNGKGDVVLKPRSSASVI